jgi:hypothetical protein
MLIEEIIEGIDVGGPGSYYSFETFVLNLLKYHLEKQDKEFVILGDNKNHFVDAIAPRGFDDFSGPTFIEIKFKALSNSVEKLIEKLAYNLEQELNFKDTASVNIIIIFAKPIPAITHEKILLKAKRLLPHYNFYIWGPNEIDKIANKHKVKVNNIVNNLFALRLESAVNKPERDWEVERELIVAQLKECYQKGQFSLFLGAGVSSSAGMPDWNSLLNSLFITYIAEEFNNDDEISDKDIDQLVGRFNTLDTPSALMAARYLRKGLVKTNKEAKFFRDAITKNLYKLRNTKFPIDSRLIKSITSMCMPRRTGAKVRSIITYNFDDLVERDLATKGTLHKSIYTESEVYDPDELPIYHVHGFLPEYESKYNDLDKSTLVFSEEGYHHIYTDAYHWSNLVQLNSFRENNCLMIGLSMTDPNLRRLLDISARSIEKSKHYTFMKRLSLENFCYEKDKTLIDNISGATKFLNIHHTLTEELMKELGVTIIWYEDYDDIPAILEKIT